MIPATKLCPACKQIKPAADYRIIPKKNGPGLYAYCRPCDLAKQSKAARLRTIAAGKEVRLPHPEVPPGSKWCSTCRKIKTLSCFRNSIAIRDRDSGLCNECARRSDRKTYLKNAYDLTPAEYEAMLEAQLGVCAICEREETAVHMGKTPRLSVDHCHKTGKIRGLLCYSCNHLVGYLERYTEEDLTAAQAYLAKHSTSAS